MFSYVIERYCDLFNELIVDAAQLFVLSRRKHVKKDVSLLLGFQWARLNQTIPFTLQHLIIAWFSENIAVKFKPVENALDTNQFCE